MNNELQEITKICNLKYKENQSIMEFNWFLDMFKGDLKLRLIENNKFYKWLIEEINYLKKSEENPVVGVNIYRSRIISEDVLGSQAKGISISNLNGYDYYNSKEPPLGVTANGRCNIQGISYFYGADNEYTSLVEVRPKILDFVSIATFIVDQPLRIADLTKIRKTNKIFYTKLLDIFRSVNPDEDFYRISQYVSEQFRRYGFDGIKYISSLSNGSNYAIFNCTSDNLKFKDSRIIRLCQVEYSFADLKNQKEIQKKLKNGLTDKSFYEAKKHMQKLVKLYEKEKYNG